MLNFSFILPCYNVAPYIKRCLDSILRQDIPQDEYEIICIDDCSSDNTVGIIEEYQTVYNNILLHKHTVNKTSGGARNTGISLARGQYIWFVDPDDAIFPNCLSNLYRYVTTANTDILFFNWLISSNDNCTTECKPFGDATDIIDGQQFISTNCHGRSVALIHSVIKAIFNRNFIIKNNIWFPEIKSSQDVIFIWKCMIKASRVSSISSLNYIYYKRSNSMTGKKGKLLSRATISASLLYPSLLLDLLNESANLSFKIRDDIAFEIRNSINDNSRNVLKMNFRERHLFKNSLYQHIETINKMSTFMNRKTKAIFAYNIPNFMWHLKMLAYISYGHIKNTISLCNKPHV